VWREFKDEAEAELQLLHRLLDEYAPLFETARATTPDRAAALALAAVVHSFYNGVENIFKRAAKLIDRELPRSGAWHVELLDAMSQTLGSRPALISGELRTRLKRYLSFRHLFRHGYSFDLDWEDMSPLVLGCANTLTQLETELAGFFDAMKGKNGEA